MIEKIENLQALVAVIEAHSLTKAADRLYVTQPIGSIASYPAPGGELGYASFRSVTASSCTELDGAACL
jgi:hypothetical protein